VTATIVSALLAGGLGTRLWPLSREIYPKQLMALVGEESLLQEAARRALLVSAPEHVLTVTTEAHFLPVRDQLGDIDPALAGNLLLEPAGRNTAAAVAVAALRAVEIAEDATLFVAPADHAVREPETVAEAVRLAAQASDSLVTFGISPDAPETGYGYIERGEALPAPDGVFAAQRFIEKPDEETAKALIAGGSVDWNSGMFVFRARLLLDELAAQAPDIYAAAVDAYAGRDSEFGAIRFPAAAYEAIPAAPIDKAVMERSDKVAVIPLDPGWSDVGSWRKLWQANARDSDGNAVQGDVVSADSRNNLLHSESRLLACAGLENMVVCETTDAVLVANLAADGAIRTIVEHLRADGRQEAQRHLAERRPWGSFRVLLDGHGFKIKEIEVSPGAQLSLQAHARRSEHWVVLEGTARVTCEDEVRTVEHNESAYIPIGAQHRLENPGQMPLRIVEVQCGDYLGEDDIIRFDDVYGRTKQEGKP
jgi:mannose-1-phosphate guanylyltransferase / mannose-6-phosphate isomerase